MRILLLLVLAFRFDSLSLAQGAQAPADPLLSRLAGQWSGTGTVLNQPSKIEMSWSWELGGQFLRLTFRNQMPKSVFEGHAYYRAVGGGPSTSLTTSRYRGMWFDNSGMFRPLDAQRDGDALVARWGTPETEEGETTYRLTSDSRMEIVDRVKSKDGKWREFGRSVVTR
jgi:hypothetical protein